MKIERTSTKWLRISIGLALVYCMSIAILTETAPGQSGRTWTSDDLRQLHNERKYTAGGMYAGPDTPEDGVKLITLVNNAIADIDDLPRPFDKTKVRNRLKTLSPMSTGWPRKTETGPTIM